ncbi:hypothetical protein PVT67_13340 [Gallaecimonas kandeliae]|uniref:hypothetical protein n=1 Tax=Gallaecimonas kandeliae TaxID=3029055 RepID=UPI002649192A|nr:hypothetical protein [Gallaecimonas kandeliae]WKE64646.1 hypothetical protein PVT67_13340 [Gallaecimonas kandeliae]
MKSVLTKAAILFGAMLITALTFWGLVASVKLESQPELNSIELALIERHQQEGVKAAAMTCDCVSDGSWFRSFVKVGQKVGCSPAYMAIANRQAIGPCHCPKDIIDYRMLPRPVPRIPAGLFRVGA